MADLPGSIRTYLIAQGLVRDPRVAGSEPPLWLDPRDGTPAPGEKDGDEDDVNHVVGLVPGVGIPGRIPEEDAVWIHRTVDFVIRVRAGNLAAPIADALEAKLAVDDAGPVGKRDWNMGGLQIIESAIWRPLQRFDASEQGYTYIESFRFLYYR